MASSDIFDAYVDYSDSALLESLLRAYKQLEGAGVSHHHQQALDRAKAVLKKHIVAAATAL